MSYEHMIERFLERRTITRVDMNVRAMTPTQMKRAIRNDDADFCRTSTIRELDKMH